MSSWEVTATNQGGGDNETPPEGNHPAVLVGLIDLGTHEDEYQGKQIQNRKALFCWELTAEHKADGSPFIVTADFNVGDMLSKKSKLRGLLESWRGKPMEDGEKLDLTKLVGKPCLINVVHGKSGKGNTFAKIAGVTPPVKGMTVPKPISEPFVWSALYPAMPASDFPAPSWLPFLYGRAVADHIAESREVRGAAAAANGKHAAPVGAGVGADDDCPF